MFNTSFSSEYPKWINDFGTIDHIMSLTILLFYLLKLIYIRTIAMYLHIL